MLLGGLGALLGLGSLGRFWGLLGMSWAVLGLLGRILGGPWAALGRSWSSVGSLLGGLGRGWDWMSWVGLEALLGSVVSLPGGCWHR